MIRKLLSCFELLYVFLFCDNSYVLVHIDNFVTLFDYDQIPKHYIFSLITGVYLEIVLFSFVEVLRCLLPDF